MKGFREWKEQVEEVKATIDPKLHTKDKPKRHVGLRIVKEPTKEERRAYFDRQARKPLSYKPFAKLKRKKIKTSDKSREEIKEFITNEWMVHYAIYFDTYYDREASRYGFLQSTWNTFTNHEKQLALQILEELRVELDGEYGLIYYHYAS